MKPMLTIKEVAEILGISQSKAQKWTSERRIPIIKINRMVRVRVEDLERWMLETNWPTFERLETFTHSEDYLKRVPSDSDFEDPDNNEDKPN